MSLELRRQLHQHVVGKHRAPGLGKQPIGHTQTGHCCRGRRSQTSRVRNFVVALDNQAWGGSSTGSEPALDRTHNEVATVERNLSGALTLDSHLETGFGCIDLDLVVQRQCDPEAVEARAQVRTRCGHQDRGGQHAFAGCD
ncbi:Uncharacterised protein [Mycobacteroides abscessus subsp. abscessus]|nr:Uncharacterised protein [Mycobacteroides abscessus subsp. abscessus]